MENKSLKSDLKKILASKENIVEVKKGDISDFSIEIEFIEPSSFSSYIYYENEKNRNLDFEKLEELIN